METRVAKRYAKALFGAAVKTQAVDPVGDDLEALNELFEANKALGEFMTSPALPRARKLALLKKAFEGRAHELTMRILEMLLDKRREYILPDVIREYAELRREFHNILRATVTSAAPLLETEQKAIETKLRVSTGKTVLTEFAIDPYLIGGVKVRIGNTVFDGTVRGSLNTLRERFIYDIRELATS